ncbi:MAG: SAM-dependent methyltransferase [Burkholderiales bacterium RIFCSPLOWO2_02_FULL_57_36]|nr:MAG: SAM-dependent methyltransferase [Burkholderiales bacterium RIFCSPLOWO2_02_FULL_57_36]
MDAHGAVDHPSAWVTRFASLIPSGEVLDLACGSGRHARLLAAMGRTVLAVDRDTDALAKIAGPNITVLQHDLEQDTGAGISWPFAENRFAGIVVTNYLHRPLFPSILASLAPNGVLLYETFARGNGRLGKPSNPAFLLEPGELLEAVCAYSASPLQIIAFEDGYIDQPKPAMVQRICAAKIGRDAAPEILRLN